MRAFNWLGGAVLAAGLIGCGSATPSANSPATKVVKKKVTSPNSANSPASPISAPSARS